MLLITHDPDKIGVRCRYRNPSEGHCLASRGSNSDPSGRIFLSAPNNHDRFFFSCIHVPFDLQRSILTLNSPLTRHISICWRPPTTDAQTDYGRTHMVLIGHAFSTGRTICWNFQDQDQDSLLVKRRNDNHSPGPVIRELVPSSHQRSELRNTILCIFSGWDQRIGEDIPIPDSLGEEATFINICIGNGSLKCHRMLIPTTLSFGDKVICWYNGFTFKTFI